MRRSKTVIKAMLQGIVKADGGNEKEVRTFIAEKTGAGTEEQDFHFALLEEAGFLSSRADGGPMRLAMGVTYTLTWKGHDLLDDLEASPLF
ncbi:hypothetical protein B0T40_15705 [Chromobacterium haemolyticum]|uniref:DUF2513 domain-containing protein n=1 Tax=Chromobacterium haemolyticum TaxID=394935 RepID=UPI0009DAFB2A|nr:DUF2513 domain-containing protein [Chromobacterium haemolyticum]OQS34287.1 hypothetical protein B0T40_15705 [Chromobacterium haemolyticum]